MIINDSYHSISSHLKKLLEKNYQSVIINNRFNSNKISDLTKDVKSNKTLWDNNETFFIKKELRESDYLIINIGIFELNDFYNAFDMDNNYILFKKLYQNLEELLVEIKKYTKDTIIFLGYYNPTDYYDSKTDKFFYNVDLKLNRLMMDNDIIYISTYELVKGNKYKDNNYLLNKEGALRIAETLYFYIN